MPKRKAKKAARKADAQDKQDGAAPPVIRSTLHLVLAGRKAARHTPRNEKRAAQKLRRELEQD
ncbi:hypothetical protein ACFSR9_07650 [Deinococcus taklimakanensis]|uniref:Uncharacterized protein n=1 Tax=Deinococcus taklimakanensis TaxID=536443 RepID=A0ABW5P2D9_9DEIO